MVELVDIENAEELDAFVREHPYGHFMQTTLWGRFRTDWDWIGLICRNEKEEICGTMAIMFRQTKLFGQMILYAPRGPVIDPEDMETFKELLSAAVELGRKKRAYLLRIDPPIESNHYRFIGTAIGLGFSISREADFGTFQPKMVYKISLEGISEYQLFQKFHPKTRYNIRLAQRRGVQIREGTEQDILAFYEMMCQTAENDGFITRTDAYYRNLLKSMGDNARLYLAELNGLPISGTICVRQGSTLWYLYGGSNLLYRNQMGSYLLQWEMIRWALETGCRTYDFRGVEGYPCIENPNYGLHRFKIGFDSKLIEYVGQMDFVMRPVSYALIKAVHNLYNK